RASEGWMDVRTHEEWREVAEVAESRYERGEFLLDVLGGSAHVDPTQAAVLFMLRRRLIDELGAASAAELMLIDMAVFAYFNALRAQGWLGSAALWFEHEFFGLDTP